MHISHYAQIFEHYNYIYARETTTPHLRSHSCFPDRLVILNEAGILLDDKKVLEKGILQKF